MAITTTDAKCAQAVAALRRVLGNGTNLSGEEKQLCLDVILAVTQSDAAFVDIAEDNVLDGRET